MMKMILTAAAVAFATPALAANYFSAHPVDTIVSKEGHFRASPETGKAWVDVLVTRSDHDIVERYSVVVPGLSFDTRTQQVVLESGNDAVTCASLKPSGWGPFKTQSLKQTGDCALRLSLNETQSLDGLAPRLKKRLAVEVAPSAS